MNHPMSSVLTNPSTGMTTTLSSSSIASSTTTTTSALTAVSSASTAPPPPPGLTTTTTTPSERSSSSTTTAAAFWELDVPTDHDHNKNVPTTTTSSSKSSLTKKSSSSSSSSSEFLTTWLQTQITTAVANAAIILPFATTATATTNTNNNNTDSTTNSNNNHTNDLIQRATRVLYQNFMTAVQSLRVTDAVPSGTNHHQNGSRENNNEDHHRNVHSMNNDNDGDEDDDDEEEDATGSTHRRKRRKRLFGKKPPRRPQILHDPYHIWFQPATTENDPAVAIIATVSQTHHVVPWNDEQDDMPCVTGGKCAILSPGGIFNAISATSICTTPVLPHSSKLLLQQAVMSGTISQWKQQQQEQIIPYLTLGHLHMIATTLHVAIAEQVKYDIVRTTPSRIQALLASDLTTVEFLSVRRRLHDTVILGKGVQQPSSNGNSDDHNHDTTLAVGASTQQHAIDKYKKCPGCGNNDQSEFVLDRKNGDLICANCGIVVSESIMHEGSQFRKFEGEVDRNHHGDASNPLYSNAHNMGTSLSSVMPTTGAGMGGRGSGAGGGRRNLETILKNAHAYTELNVSQFGRTDARRTRVGYKDRQKKSAFAQMTHAGDALNLHEAVVQRAKELFAGFRDDRELVQQFKGILAACLCEAFEQLSAEGKHLLRQQQQMFDQQQQGNASTATNDTVAATTALDAENPSASMVLSGRAARRSELHHATMAGKGGLLLNTPVTSAAATASLVKSSTVTTTTTTDGVDDPKAEKLATTWDLEDCRSWLLNASRRIAQNWVNERKNHPDVMNGNNTTTNNNNNNSNIPTGSVDELEGRLVEHAITLCEHLENELQSRATSSTASSSNKSTGRVVTPRLSDMTKLGIKWQHSHERGSGGKGGVGGSGVTNTANAVNRNQRTAGQILLLKTSKKLGTLLNDPVAGDAIHHELRNVITRQEGIKQREMRDEATRQRLNQMQRKPWLAAKAQQQN